MKYGRKQYKNYFTEIASKVKNRLFFPQKMYILTNENRDVLLHLSNESCDGSDRTVK